jgi:response regulator NasT
VGHGKQILRVLVVAEREEHANLVAEGLKHADCELVGRITQQEDLARAVGGTAPDVVIIALDSPPREVLEAMRALNRHHPLPIVMFAHAGETETIEAATDAGASSYIVDGLSSPRVRPIIGAAIARFRQFQALRRELDKAKSSLDERKLVERAKGIVMRKNRCEEEEAYQSLRKMAMSSNQRLAEVARKVIEVSELFG